MKNKLKLIIASFVLAGCFTSCLQSSSEKDCIDNENFCDYSNNLSGYYFFDRFYLEGDESCLDSALMVINKALPMCEEKKFDMSIRKLAVLCGKREYDQAISFMDSIDFKEQDYSLYETIIRKRLFAMKYHDKMVKNNDVENLKERNRYLKEIIDILDDYLARNSASVDSVWMIIDDGYYDSIVMATAQYYFYLSVLKNDEFAISKVDSLYNCGKINQTGLERLKNVCHSRVDFMTFLGI